MTSPLDLASTFDGIAATLRGAEDVGRSALALRTAALRASLACDSLAALANLAEGVCLSPAGFRAVILQHGKRYAIEEGGNVRRLDLAGFEPSGQWRIIGAATRNNFGHVVRRWTLAEVMTDPGAIPWRWKNGTQRTYLRDLDHGTAREWGHPPHSVVLEPVR